MLQKGVCQLRKEKNEKPVAIKPIWFDAEIYCRMTNISNNALASNIEARTNLYDLLISKKAFKHYDDSNEIYEFHDWYSDVLDKVRKKPVIINFDFYKNKEFNLAIENLYGNESTSHWIDDEDVNYETSLTNSYVSSITDQDIVELIKYKSQIPSLNNTDEVLKQRGTTKIYDIEKNNHINGSKMIKTQPDKLYLKVDISVTKDKLVKEFEDWVKVAKKEFNLFDSYSSVTQEYIDRYIKNNLIGFLDIRLWSLFQKTKPTDTQISDWITPSSENTILIKRHKKLAYASLNFNFINALRKFNPDPHN